MRKIKMASDAEKSNEELARRLVHGNHGFSAGFSSNLARKELTKRAESGDTEAERLLNEFDMKWEQEEAQRKQNLKEYLEHSDPAPITFKFTLKK